MYGMTLRRMAEACTISSPVFCFICPAIRVSVSPGATAFMRTPPAASSFAPVFVKAISAALEAP